MSFLAYIRVLVPDAPYLTFVQGMLGVLDNFDNEKKGKFWKRRKSSFTSTEQQKSIKRPIFEKT